MAETQMEKGIHLKFAHTEGRACLRYSPDGRCACAALAKRRLHTRM